jgi:hypothetical protein
MPITVKNYVYFRYCPLSFKNHFNDHDPFKLIKDLLKRIKIESKRI